MDREIFLGVSPGNQITARKILSLINRFTTISDFRVISDRRGFGYSGTGRGRGVDNELAAEILARRPVGDPVTGRGSGYTSIWDLLSVPGMGADTWSDIVISAMRLVRFPQTESLTLTFYEIQTVVDPVTRESRTDFLEVENLSVLLYAKLVGSNADQWTPLYLETSDELGKVSFGYITEDIAEYAIVAAREDSDNPIFRSGALLPNSSPESDLRAVIYLVEANDTISEDVFNSFLSQQVGTTFDGDKTLTALSARFRNNYMELEGTITVADTFLRADSDIDFESQIFLGPSARIVSGLSRPGYRLRRSDPFVANLDQLVKVSGLVTSSEHSNWLMKSLGFFGVSIPGLLGFAVPGAVLAIDSSLDSDQTIQNQIRDSITAQFSTSSFDIIEEAIRAIAADDPDFNQLGFLAVYPEFSGIDTDDPEAIIEFMVRRSTVDSISITPDGITLNAWVVVPYAF